MVGRLADNNPVNCPLPFRVQTDKKEKQCQSLDSVLKYHTCKLPIIFILLPRH